MLPHLDRRQFVAAALASPAPLFLRSARTPANDRVTLGVIGTGIRGRNLLRGSFLPNDGFQVLAVCDVDTTRRMDTKRIVDEHYETRDCAAYLDYHELLARDDLDAVVIATPDHWHAIQSIDACKAGKDVYCEKPLTHTLHEGETVIRAARAHGRVFQTGSQQRTEYAQRFVIACELVRNGRIGDVQTANVGVGIAPRWCDLGAEPREPGLDWDRWLGPAPERPYHSDLSPRGVHDHYPSWRAYREYSSGYLADMGAHHFDIVQWALKADEGGPVRVEPAPEPGATHGASLIYPGGVRVVHGGPGGVTFVGSAGVLRVDRGELVSIPGSILETELGADDEHLPRWPGHAAEWLAAIQERRPPICDVEIGARSAAVCQLLNLVYWNGRALDWDPVAWRFVDDDEANGWRDEERREGYRLPRV